MSATAHFDVVVVGAGPVGLVPAAAQAGPTAALMDRCTLAEL